MSDIVKNMKESLQHDQKHSGRLWMMFIGVFVGIGYLGFLGTSSLVEILGGETEEQKVVRSYESSAARVDAVVTPLPSVRAKSRTFAASLPRFRPAGMIHRQGASSTAMPPLVKPKWQQATNARPVKVFTTSSAKVHNIGAGMGARGESTGTTVMASSAIPFSSSTSSIVMPTAVWTSTRALSAQNTLASEQQMLASSDASSQARPGNIRRGFPGDDDDPFPDPETPIGDGFVAMLLAALVYAASLIMRRKKQTA